MCVLGPHKKARQSFGSPVSGDANGCEPMCVLGTDSTWALCKSSKGSHQLHRLSSPAGGIGWYCCYIDSILAAPGVLPTQETRRKEATCWA